MPLYEYECAKCSKRFEKIEKMTAPHRQKCPHCGGKAERRLAPSAIQFKGSGWYVTDYAGKGKAKAEASQARESTEAKEAKETKETQETKETKAETPAKETKKHHKGE